MDKSDRKLGKGATESERSLRFAPALPMALPVSTSSCRAAPLFFFFFFFLLFFAGCDMSESQEGFASQKNWGGGAKKIGGVSENCGAHNKQPALRRVRPGKSPRH